MNDLRTLWAVQRLLTEKDPYLNDWLMSRRPVTQLRMLHELVPALTAPPAVVSCQPSASQQDDASRAKVAGPSGPSMQDVSQAHLKPLKPQPPAPDPVARTAQQPGAESAPHQRQEAATSTPTHGARLSLPLGLKQPGGAPLTMPLGYLSEHTVILAGAGSGKTVLLRRLVEEAAIHRTPAIVIDCANDLCSLGQAWPRLPNSWTAEDEAKAQQYHANTEVVVWTPGVRCGNPLVLEPLPDFAAVADDKEQLTEAIVMARESLRPLVAPGKGFIADKKNGILGAALMYFAQQTFRTLADLAALLSDLPPEAGLELKNEAKLACDMADALKVHMATNPMLQTYGAALDPALLFGDVPGCDKVRVSVINLMGLPSLEMQQKFLNQLAMVLFVWIKKNPCPPGRALRGLLAIDEAKDFVPSVGNAACKHSLKPPTARAPSTAWG